MDDYELEAMRRARDHEPYVFSRCIAISENAVSFDVEMYWTPEFVRFTESVKVNVIVAKNLKTSLSYPYDQGRPFAEKEKWLIDHCIERAKVIFQIEGA